MSSFPSQLQRPVLLSARALQPGSKTRLKGLNQGSGNGNKKGKSVFRDSVKAKLTYIKWERIVFLTESNENTCEGPLCTL